jgi:hypothetical protein
MSTIHLIYLEEAVIAGQWLSVIFHVIQETEDIDD